MTPQRVRRLVQVAEKPERLIVGLMSGTSLDGLDIALCKIRGAGEGTHALVVQFATVVYDEPIRDRLREVVFRGDAPLHAVCDLNAWLADRHSAMVLRMLGEWKVKAADVDVLASHGQTVFHAPQHRSTLQLVDGDHMALRTGLLTVSDFRQKELAGGGEGAPLAPYAEALLYRSTVPRLLLNIGGIANFTWLPARGDNRPARSGDTGPGNTLIDRAVRTYWPDGGAQYDPGGAFAADGRIHAGLLRRLKQHPYFARRFPKSTGPEEFNAAYLDAAIAAAEVQGGKLSPVDVVATVTQLTAETIADCLRTEVRELAGVELIASGGGQRNRTLMGALTALLPGAKVIDSAALGVPPDAKEALLFAVLANELVAGPGWPARDGSGRNIAFGKISFPD
jgi:anhydro-N-acetylmuramic acid kinase